MCGKNSDIYRQLCNDLGSPPRVREKLQRLYFFKSALGITPACAGKTFPLSRYQIHGQDHPRVCGKNKIRDVCFKILPGSPPRVREKLESIGKAAGSIGITPACAGKTFPEYPALLVTWDHPRVCGKNQTSINANTALVGSPPRVREKLKAKTFKER